MKDGKAGARSNSTGRVPAPGLKSFLDERVQWIVGYASRWMFKFIIKNSPELLTQYISKRANELALGITMTILDREGIAHCFRCPQRFALKKVGGRYACLKHSQEVGAVAA